MSSLCQNPLVPNSYQHPNFYTDKLSYFLSPEEEKILNRAIREILGWQNKIEARRARIALSIFVDGAFRKGQPKTEENRLSWGCGLSLNCVRKCLKALDDFNILVKVGEPTQNGQEFELQTDPEQIKWDLLELRKAGKIKENIKRITPAIEAANTPTVAQHPYRRTVPPPLPSHDRNKTHSLNPSSLSKDKEEQAPPHNEWSDEKGNITSKHPAVIAYRETIRRYPSKDIWPDLAALIGVDPDRIALFKEVLVAFRQLGWNCTNATGLWAKWVNSGKVPSADLADPRKRTAGKTYKTNKTDAFYLKGNADVVIV